MTKYINTKVIINSIKLIKVKVMTSASLEKP
jgi:hypothetical protein